MFNNEHEKVVKRIVPPTSEQGRAPGDWDADIPARPPPSDGADSDGAKLRLVVDADWVSPSLARGHIRRWLGDLRWPQRRIDEMVLAVSEVVSNSIEHGYGLTVDRPEPPTELVEIDGHVSVDDSGFSRAVVTVTDHGTWRTPDTGPSNRGRGTLLARACTDELRTEHRSDGTTVVLHSRPIPPPLSDRR